MKSRKNALTDYLQSLYNIPTLTQAEEVGLAHLIAQGDDHALEKLVTHNLRFVVSVIKKMPNWSHSNMPMEDLLSFGNEALMNAARKWQPQGKIRFASYAKKFIQLDVQRGVANTKNIIRLPIWCSTMCPTCWPARALSSSPCRALPTPGTRSARTARTARPAHRRSNP